MRDVLCCAMLYCADVKSARRARSQNALFRQLLFSSTDFEELDDMLDLVMLGEATIFNGVM